MIVIVWKVIFHTNSIYFQRFCKVFGKQGNKLKTNPQYRRKMLWLYVSNITHIICQSCNILMSKKRQYIRKKKRLYLQKSPLKNASDI